LGRFWRTEDKHNIFGIGSTGGFWMVEDVPEQKALAD
jgi:hypothetical protein